MLASFSTCVTKGRSREMWLSIRRISLKSLKKSDTNTGYRKKQRHENQPAKCHLEGAVFFFFLNQPESSLTKFFRIISAKRSTVACRRRPLGPLKTWRLILPSLVVPSGSYSLTLQKVKMKKRRNVRSHGLKWRWVRTRSWHACHSMNI